MSEKDKKELEPARTQEPRVEPEAGKGTRSLANWRSLAQARQSLGADTANLQAFQRNPAAYLQRFGMDVRSLGGVDPTAFALGAGPIEQLTADGETQLAFCKVWGIAIAVAAAAIKTLAIVNAYVNANVVANLNVMANANVGANTWGDGDGGGGGDGPGDYPVPDPNDGVPV